jgi:dGTPase
LIWTLAQREERQHKKTGGDQRTHFERDRDRILYSSAFQRLAGITQIVRAGEGGVFHTRQQHTMKVAQVGRRLGQKLLREQAHEAEYRGLDPEVVEAACMAHDLGHPPFGHVGEHILHELVTDRGDTDGFEGNAQSFRILTKLAVRFPDFHGIDMTRATLAACLKYPWLRGTSGKKKKKWSAYRSEEEAFKFAREFHPHEEKTLEAELMDWADDVAYSVHDLEDFHRCNALPWRRVFSDRKRIVAHAAGGSTDAKLLTRLGDAYDRLASFFFGTYSAWLEEPYEGTSEQREQLRRMTSQLIGKYINSIQINPNRDEPKAVVFNRDEVDEVAILKQITRDYIIASPTLAAQQEGQKRIIRELFTAFASDMENESGYPPFVPIRLRYLKPLADTSHMRFVADSIASLSEAEAVALHARLTGTNTGSVLDPIVR